MALKQGAHIDPLDASVPSPNPREWSAIRARAYHSSAMKHYREALLLPNLRTAREAVVDDLSKFYDLTPEVCVERCIHWEEWSVEEWQAKARDDRAGLLDFYRSTHSWSFDLSWYAYLQAEGYAYPVSVAIAASLPPRRTGRRLRHLDFGSGVGTTSQLFRRLGYESDMADVSSTLLDFARFRHERRGETISQIDLSKQSLPRGEYDVITAIDALAHVPDLPETARQLHAALRPGGVLFANFDTRPPSPENAWHLYTDDIPLRYQLQRAGFDPQGSLDNYSIRYRRIEHSWLGDTLRHGRDFILLGSPLRPLYRQVKVALRGR